MQPGVLRIGAERVAKRDGRLVRVAGRQRVPPGPLGERGPRIDLRGSRRHGQHGRHGQRAQSVANHFALSYAHYCFLTG